MIGLVEYICYPREGETSRSPKVRFLHERSRPSRDLLLFGSQPPQWKNPEGPLRKREDPDFSGKVWKDHWSNCQTALTSINAKTHRLGLMLMEEEEKVCCLVCLSLFLK